jgi:hypothetical protein
MEAMQVCTAAPGSLLNQFSERKSSSPLQQVIRASFQHVWLLNPESSMQHIEAIQQFQFAGSAQTQ